MSRSGADLLLPTTAAISSDSARSQLVMPAAHSLFSVVAPIPGVCRKVASSNRRPSFRASWPKSKVGGRALAMNFACEHLPHHFQGFCLSQSVNRTIAGAPHAAVSQLALGQVAVDLAGVADGSGYL